MPGSSIKPFEVPFAGGYQQKKAEPWVDASAQTDDVNVIWIKSPAPEKRPGYLGLTRSVVIPGIVNGGNWFQNTVSTVAGFFADESGVCVTDGTNLYTYSTANTWQWADFVSPFVCTRKTVTSSETSVFNPDVAEYPAGDVRVFVWEDGTGSPTVNTQIRYAMKSISTGAVIATGIVDKNTTGIHPRVFVLGSDAYVLWGEFVHGSAGHVYYSSAPLTTANGPFGNGLTWQSATALVSNRVDFGTTQGGAWDVAVADDGSGAVLVYENTSHQIVVQKYKSPIQNTLVVDGSSAVVANETGTLFRCLGVRWAVASDTIWIGIGWSSDNRAQAVNFKASTLVQQIGSPVAIQLAGYQAACTSIAIEDIGGVGWYVWSHGGGTVHEPNFVRSASVTSPGGAIVQGPVSLNVQLCSRPFAQVCSDQGAGVRLYAWVANGVETTSGTDVPQQVSQVLAEIDINGVEGQLRPVGVVAPRLVSTRSATVSVRDGGALSSVTGVGNPAQTARSYAGVISQSFLSLDDGGSFLLLDVAADAGHPGRFTSVRLGDLVYTGGGLPSTFDGSTLSECGTVSDPSQAVIVTDGGVGGGLADNLAVPYQWVFVYEWVDHHGNVQRGQPSVPVSHTLAAGQHEVNLAIPCLSLTKKGLEFREACFGDSQLQIAVYRTTWNAALSTMSETFYFVGYVHNDDTLYALTYLDSRSDASVMTTATILPLYTTGDVLESNMPSSFAAICAHQNRIYGIGDDLRTIWISTELEPGAPVRFNDGSQLLINSIGDLTAIWSLEGNLFFASADRIGFVSGAGPSDTGAQNDLSTPTILPGDVGVVDPRAICLIPAGIVFAHRYGLGLLDRSLSVHSDFGDPVEDLLTGATVTSMTLHPTRPELVVCAATQTAGRTLVFNYRFNAWSLWNVFDPAWNGVHHSAVPWTASATIGGVLYGGTPGGTVFSERPVSDSARYWDKLDAATDHYVPMTATTAWIKPAGALQAWGRVNYLELLWGVQDWHNLTATIAYDYNTPTSTLSPGTITSASITTFADVQASTGGVTRFKFHPSVQKCSAFRVSFSDSNPGTAPAATSGQGPRLLAVTAGLRPSGAGMYRTPEVQRG